MKKVASLALASVLYASVALAEPLALVYAEVNPLDTIMGQVALAFKEKVEELSGGEVVIDVRAGGVLGSEPQVLDDILGGGGTVDITRTSAFALTSYGCQKSSMLALPYTFVDREHFWKFATSPLADELLAEPKDIGLPLRSICYGEEGFRHFFFKGPVSGIGDMKGKKIRVSEDPIMTGMVRDLGALPTVVTFTELYGALRDGVTDGAEQPIVNYRSNAFHEVAPYLLLDGHTLGVTQIIITDSGWDKLDDRQRAWIMEAARHAQQENARISADKEREVLAQLELDGVHVIDVADKAPWIEACQRTITARAAARPDIYEALIKIR